MGERRVAAIARVRAALGGHGVTNLVIVVWLAAQVAVPATWYLTGGGWDERFSWRMFSVERLTRCGVRVIDEGASGARQQADLNREVQRGWISYLSRGQPLVVDAFLRRRCQEPGVTRTRLKRRCTDPAGEKLPEIVVERECPAAGRQ